MPNLKDFATALIITAPTPATSGTSLVVESGKGVRFPTPPFYATIHPATSVPTLDNAEKVQVTAISTDTFTIVRAQSPTSAQTITGSSAYRISNTVFAADLYNTSLVMNEVPGGSVNGSNTAFTTAAAFTAGTLRVFLNGQRLTAGASADYTEATALNGFTMNYAPATGDVLLADYNIGSTAFVMGGNSFLVNETPTGSVNSSNTSFTVSKAKYVAGSLEVYLNGLKQTATTDFTETTPTSGVFTMTTAPTTGDTIRVNYQYSFSSAGNADTVDGIHANSTATANNLYPLNASSVYPLSVLQSQVIGYVEVTGNFTTTSLSAVQITGLTLTVTIPAGVTRVEVSAFCPLLYTNSNGVAAHFHIWQGTVGSGTQLQESRGFQSGSSGTGSPSPFRLVTVTPGNSYTFNMSLHTESAATATMEAASTKPAILMVKAA